MVKDGGTLFFDHLWAFLTFWAKTVRFQALSDCKVLKKTVHHLYGATSDALQMVYLGGRDTGDTKYTLWRASEGAP